MHGTDARLYTIMLKPTQNARNVGTALPDKSVLWFINALFKTFFIFTGIFKVLTVGKQWLPDSTADKDRHSAWTILN